MGDRGILKVIYTFFLGLLLVMFVGVGIDTFYPGPTAPEYPVELNSAYGKALTDEQAAAQRTYDTKMTKYNHDMQPYNRNVSIAALATSVIFLGASIALERRVALLTHGLMLGGLFTLVYSIARGFASADSKYVFIVISIGLVVVLLLGYRHFVREKRTSIQ